MGRHQFLLQGYSAHQIQEERLAGPVLADDDPEHRAALPDALDVLQHHLHFSHAADLNQLLSCARHYPGSQGLHDQISISGTNDTHAQTVSIKSRAISIGSSPSAIRASNFSSAASLTRSRAPSNINSISAAISLSS